MKSEIEYAEIRLNDGDGNDYINFYVDGITHSYLLEEVFEQFNGKLPCGHSARYQALDAIERPYCVMCKAENLQHENDFMNGVIAGLDGAS